MISVKEVSHLAVLARVGVEEKETKKLQKDLEEILEYVGELQKANTKNTKPISHITGLENQEREDKEKEHLSSPEILREQAPQKKGRWVRVEKVISKE